MFLQTKQPDSEELVKMIDYSEEKTIKVIRWLLDHNKIIQDKDHKLSGTPDDCHKTEVWSSKPGI